MKIGIQTWGSAGDINPFIALSAGLAKAGHQVTLAITSAERRDFLETGRRLGFTVMPVGHIAQSETSLDRLGERIVAASDPLKQLRITFREMFEPDVPRLFEAAKTLCANNDLIVAHYILHPTHLAAELAKKPYATVTLNRGALPTRMFPPPSLPNLGPWINPWLWTLTEKLLGSVLLPSINRLREREGAPPVRTYRRVWESPLCNLIAVGGPLCPAMPDWGENQKICGFFPPPEADENWTVPDALAAFLDSGPPPVFIGFGSMLGAGKWNANMGKCARLLSEAVRIAGCRAILQSRWDAVEGVPENPAIFRIETVPYARIFPRCSAIVHHGGAGTTHTAILSGHPSVVIAHMMDQFFWGEELRRLGIAPKTLAYRNVTANAIAAAIREALSSPAMAERAKTAGRELAKEDGIGTAVRRIEEVFSVEHRPKSP